MNEYTHTHTVKYTWETTPQKDYGTMDYRVNEQEVGEGARSGQ